MVQLINKGIVSRKTQIGKKVKLKKKWRFWRQFKKLEECLRFINT